MTDQEQSDGLWDGAELVIYTVDAGEVEADPCTEWGKQLGMVGYSLWARWEDKETEVPIYSASETGTWLSMSSQMWNVSAATTVSDAFVKSIVYMVDEDKGDGWGDPTEAVWDELRDVEKRLWHSTQWAFLKMESPEAAGVIEWCHTRYAELKS